MPPDAFLSDADFLEPAAPAASPATLTDAEFMDLPQKPALAENAAEAPATQSDDEFLGAQTTGVDENGVPYSLDPASTARPEYMKPEDSAATAIWKTAKNVPQALKYGLASTFALIHKSDIESNPDKPPSYNDEQWSQRMFEWAENAKLEMRRNNPNITPHTAFAASLHIADSVVQLAPLLATGPLALPLMGATTLGPNYEAARDRGVPADQAATEAGLKTAFEVVTAAVPIKIAKETTGSLLEHVLNSGSAFAIQTGATTAVEQAYDARELATKDNIPYGEAWDKLGGLEAILTKAAEAGETGAIVGGGHRVIAGDHVTNAAKEHIGTDFPADAAHVALDRMAPPPFEAITGDGPPPSINPGVLTRADHESPIPTDLTGGGKTFIDAANAHIDKLIPSGPQEKSDVQESSDEGPVRLPENEGPIGIQNAEDGVGKTDGTKNEAAPVAAGDGTGANQGPESVLAAPRERAGTASFDTPAPAEETTSKIALKRDGTPWATDKGALMSVKGRDDLKGKEWTPVQVEGGWGLEPKSADGGRPPLPAVEAPPSRPTPKTAEPPKPVPQEWTKGVNEQADRAAKFDNDLADNLRKAASKAPIGATTLDSIVRQVDGAERNHLAREGKLPPLPREREWSWDSILTNKQALPALKAHGVEDAVAKGLDSIEGKIQDTGLRRREVNSFNEGPGTGALKRQWSELAASANKYGTVASRQISGHKLHSAEKLASTRAELEERLRAEGVELGPTKDSHIYSEPAKPAEAPPAEKPIESKAQAAEAVAKLKGDELAPAGAPFAELRKSALAWYRKNLVGKRVDNTATGRTISFSETGANKTSRAGEDLLRTVPAIREMLRDAKPVGAPQPDKLGRANVKAWHNFEARVEVDGKTRTVGLKVREDNNGSFHYSIHQGDEPGSMADATGARSGRLADELPTHLEGASGSKDNIGAPAPEGKSEGVPELAPHEGSWVVVKKGTLDSVLETFEKKTAEAVNREKYDVLTIGGYLGRKNREIKAAKPTPKETRRKPVDMVDRLENFYQPGSVHRSSYWGTLNKVTEFKREGGFGGGWQVTEHTVDKNGVRTEERDRTHSTMPTDNDLAAWEKKHPVPDKPKGKPGERGHITLPTAAELRAAFSGPRMTKMREMSTRVREVSLDAAREARMALEPMAMGSTMSISTAKNFANAQRLMRDWKIRTDKFITDNFTVEQQEKMWIAGHDQDVLQKREIARIEELNKTNPKRTTDLIPKSHFPGKGYDSLTDKERVALRNLQIDGDEVFNDAIALGMIADPEENGYRRDSYVPRRIVDSMTGKPFPPTKGTGSNPLDMMGRNLRTSSKSLMHMKHETWEETEAAAKLIFGDTAVVVKNIRTLPMVTAEIRSAVAGRTLINEIRRQGLMSGNPTVFEGHVPEGIDTFTIEHPAMYTMRPKFQNDPDSDRMIPLHDENGRMLFERVPLRIVREFEGPLRAVLSTEDGKIYRGLMDLKGRSMSVIMYSPLIHNGVEWGRAMPAFPGKVFSTSIYWQGNAARRGMTYTGVWDHLSLGKFKRPKHAATEQTLPVDMKEAITAGMVPIGNRGAFQDISSITQDEDISPGRSWTAQLLSAVPGMFSPRAGEAVKRAIDKAGDVWHNKLLWDRVADLQMGLYINFRDSLGAKGFDPTTAQRVAAHLANRYAGALPIEAMSEYARKTANLLLFSRSFTFGNLGAMKDALTGLPADVRAQIMRDAGAATAKLASSAVRKKSFAIILADVGLKYVAGSILASTVATMLATTYKDDPFWLRYGKRAHDETLDYLKRAHDLMLRVKEDPMTLLSPIQNMQSLTPMGRNEPGKRDRILVGHADDGSAIYANPPIGKVGGEFEGWATGSLEMINKKLSTFARPVLQTLTNERGYGDYHQHVYDPDDDAPGYVLRDAGKIALNFLRQQVPTDSAQSLIAMIGKREQDQSVNEFKTFGPLFGTTFSKGAKGGERMGEYYRARSEQNERIIQAMPDIRDAVKAGDDGKAREIMEGLHIDRAEQRRLINSVEDAREAPSARQMRTFRKYATPDQIERVEGQR